MTPLAKVLIGGAIAVVVFDALASVAALQLGFDYTRAAFGSWLIYAAVGFLAARAGGGLPPALLAGIILGLVDATVGWAVSWAVGPGRPPEGTLSVGRWAVAAITVAVTGGCIGLLGGVVARLTAGRGAPAA
jgi:hypothetical protein